MPAGDFVAIILTSIGVLLCLLCAMWWYHTNFDPPPAADDTARPAGQETAAAAPPAALAALASASRASRPRHTGAAAAGWDKRMSSPHQWRAGRVTTVRSTRFPAALTAPETDH